MNIYREYLWSGLYRKESRKFTILPQKLTTYKLTNLQYGRSCWSSGVEQLRVDSMDVRTNLVFPQEKNIYFPLPTISSSLRVYRNPVSAFRVGNVFVSGLPSYLLWKLSRTDLGQTVIIYIIILIYLDHHKSCNYELESLMYVYLFAHNFWIWVEICECFKLNQREWRILWILWILWISWI